MSAPTITIELKIQVPMLGGVPIVTTAVTEDRQGPAARESGVEGRSAKMALAEDKKGPVEPRDKNLSVTRCPDTDQRVPVRPSAGSGSGAATGTICAWAQFTNNLPDQARAQVVAPADLGGVIGMSAPDFGATVSGTKLNGGALWQWTDGSNPIPNVLHSSGGEDNHFVLWSKVGTAAWDKEHYPFVGFTGTNDPCGSASGAPCFSGSGGFEAMLTQGHPVLRVQVADGPKSGSYLAQPVAALKWAVDIAAVRYEIHLTADGTGGFFCCPTTAVRAKSAGQVPVFAVFPGVLLGAVGDVVVHAV